MSVTAWDVGKPMMAGLTAYGLEPWYFDEEEFLIWTFSEITSQETVAMSSLRFKNLERRIPFTCDAAKLSGFSIQDLEEAKSDANCEIICTRPADGFLISQAALWISFKVMDERGETLEGTLTGKPYRLDRAY